MKSRGRKVLHKCAQCETEFTDFISNDRKYCCRRCYELAKRGTTASEETRAKMRRRVPWNRGREGLLKPEAIEKMRRAAIGRAPGNKGIPLSPEARRRISEATAGIKKPAVSVSAKQRTGEKAPRWQGGITPLNTMIRHSQAYKDWRTAVFARDNYTCHECGQHQGDIQAHHIKPFSKHPELRFDVNNGLTVCVTCHERIHGRPIRIRRKAG